MLGGIIAHQAIYGCSRTAGVVVDGDWARCAVKHGPHPLFAAFAVGGHGAKKVNDTDCGVVRIALLHALG